MGWLFHKIAQRGKQNDFWPSLWPLMIAQINPLGNLRISHPEISHLPHQSNQNEMMPKSSDLSLKITSLSPSQKCHTSHQHSNKNLYFIKYQLIFSQLSSFVNQTSKWLLETSVWVGGLVGARFSANPRFTSEWRKYMTCTLAKGPYVFGRGPLQRKSESG